MIQIDDIKVIGWEHAVRGMRNPMNSWDKSDSYHETFGHYIIGNKDLDLMMRLAKAGSTHAKYRRMIVVYMDVTAPLYWWKETDTYKIGTVANSCSTMHKIHSRDLTLEDFSTDHLTDNSKEILQTTIDHINIARIFCANEKIYDKNAWWQIIQLLPSSYNQRRTLMLNYEVLSHIYYDRKDHKLDEWRDFCEMIKTLPYSQIITLEE